MGLAIGALIVAVANNDSGHKITFSASRPAGG
jgi:hypothetical protein